MSAMKNLNPLNLHLGYLSNELERLFNTLVANFCAFLEFRIVRIPVEAQDEVRFVSRDGN